MPSTMVDAAVAVPTPPLDRVGRRRRRPAALPNANAGAGAAAPSKPKAKSVASRYLLTPTSKPNSTSSTASPAARPPTTSAERSRPAPPSAVPADAGGGAATTTRTLSVAFQGPTYCFSTSKAARSVSPATVLATTPEKAGTAARTKVPDGAQSTYRWPASAGPCAHDGRARVPEHSYSASVRKEPAAMFGAAVRSTRAAFDAAPRRASVDGGANEYLLALSSDTDSASSGGSGSGDAGGFAPRRSVGGSRRSIMTSSSARFSHDAAAGTRSERFACPVTPLPPPPPPVKKRSLFNGFLSSPFGRSSLNKQQSPSKTLAASFGRTASPSRPRRSVDLPLPGHVGKLQGKVSPADYGVDEGDMKVKPPAASKAEEEHRLRLLYTQHLQWRLANAQAGGALSSQAMVAEKTLCGAWISILRMRKSVAMRKVQLQLIRDNCKLVAILRGQMKYLDEWSFLERDYAHSLSGTTQALNATVLRLPVSDGATADIQAVRNAVGSAVDVMHTIGNSTSTQLPKLARTNVLVSQLSRVATQEHILMAQSRELLSTLASMHVKYSSLQGQRIQLNQRKLMRFQ